MIFWDYDTQWGAERSRGKGGPKPWGPLEFVFTDRLLELHGEFGVPACFAVVGAAALSGDRPYHDPDQIKRIHAAGHEVGSHSFRHDWLPGLSRENLLETLRSSKDAIEQCIGAEVISFVPPYNQPFDHAPGLSISVSERIKAGRNRVTLGRLCASLLTTGYRFCRVAYRPLHLKAADIFLRRPLPRSSEPEKIEGIVCVRQEAPAGFAETASAFLRHVVQRGGMAIAYGHPHSLGARNDQNETCLVRFLKEVVELRAAGHLDVILPRELLRTM
jgi:peptidoglycan/xylan/chitin deacetylase (PgdA/CDA1 family)